MIRKNIAEGRFYPESRDKLEEIFNKIEEKEKDKFNEIDIKKNVIGGVVPHAGFIYSGYEAYHFFKILELQNKKYDTVILINPNHTGYGNEIEVDFNDYWESSYGNIEIDKEFSEKLNIAKGIIASKYEHSGEVEIPFLKKYLNSDFKLVNIIILNQNPKNAKFIAEEIFRVKNILKKEILIIASSDFSHYVNPKYGKENDDYVLKKILEFDLNETYNRIIERKVSICGYAPIMTLMEYSKLITKNPKSKILRQGHSGEVYPSNEVVDYVSILFYKE